MDDVDFISQLLIVMLANTWLTNLDIFQRLTHASNMLSKIHHFIRHGNR